MADKRKKAAQSLKRKMTKAETAQMEELLPFLKVPPTTDFTKRPDKEVKQITAADLVPPPTRKADEMLDMGKSARKYRGKDIEDQRVKQLLGERAKDPQKVKEFKEFRKKAAEDFPFETVDYVGYTDIPVKGETSFVPYEFLTPIMKLGKGAKIEIGTMQDDVKDKLGTLSHEFGHAIDLKRPGLFQMFGADQVDNNRFTVVRFRDPKLQKTASEMTGYMNDRAERQQYSIVPIKVAIRNVFGSVPTNKKEFVEMRETLRQNPVLRGQIVRAAKEYIPSGYDPKNPRDTRGRFVIDAFTKAVIDKDFKVLFEQDKVDEDITTDFLRAAKAETKDDVPSRTA